MPGSRRVPWLPSALLTATLLAALPAPALEVLGSYATPGTARDVAAVGSIAYVVDHDALRILDVSDPANPALLSSFPPPIFGSFFQVVVDGSLAYLAQGQAGLTIVDVSDPAAPVFVSRTDPDPIGITVHRTVAVEGATAYLGDASQVRIYDVSTPSAPVFLGAVPESGDRHIDAVGTRLYVTNLAYLSSLTDLSIWDVSSPAAPVELGEFSGTGGQGAVVVDGSHAYLSDAVVDVSDPAIPLQTGDLPLHTSDVAVTGIQLLVTQGTSGSVPFSVYDRSVPGNPVLGSAGAPFCNAHPSLGIDLELVDTTLYCAAVGEGLRIVDVSDWTQPVLLADLSGETEARDVEVLGGRAYLAVGGDGMRIYDVSDPASPALLGGFDPGSPITYDLEVFGGRAYLAHGFGGLRIVDVSDPTAPTSLGVFVSNGQIHEIALAGDRVYAADPWNDEFLVVDVADPANPTSLGSLPLALATTLDVVAVDDLVYLASDHVDDLWIIDVSSPATPAVIGTAALPDDFRELAVAGDRLYVATLDTVQIFDVSSPATPTLLDSSAVGARGLLVRGHLVHTDGGLLSIQDDDALDFGELPSLPYSGAAEAVAVANGLALVVQQPDGLVVIDPTLPTPPFGPCNDGLDNDGDGDIDIFVDVDCRDFDDLSEEPDCSDGLDNDGDGFTDFGSDPGCANAFSQTESPQCQNGFDDDGDGLIDGADPQCTQPWKQEKKSGCGLGYELALALAMIAPLRRRRRVAARREGAL